MRVEFVHLFLSYYRRFFKSILSIGKVYSLRIFWCIFVYVYFVFSEEIKFRKCLTKNFDQNQQRFGVPWSSRFGSNSYGRHLQRSIGPRGSRTASLRCRNGVDKIRKITRESDFLAKITLEKIEESGREVLPHVPHSPDLAPSEYHLFWSMQHFLGKRKFTNREEVQLWVSNYF